MTLKEVLFAAQSKWPTSQSRAELLEKYKCTPLYLSHILSGNKRIPGWMLIELGIEKIKVVQYRRRG